MAAGMLPRPGSKLGPCKSACVHRDCGETRMMAEEMCRICRKPIGYDRLFFSEGTIRQLVHESCAARLAEHAQYGS